MLTKKEMYEIIKKHQEELESEYFYAGIRFEDKERTVGEIITDYSRHNSDRDDERAFPEFGSSEYEEMEELDGVSAWDLTWESAYSYQSADADRPCDYNFITKHCYLIASDKAMSTMNYDLDPGEIVLIDAKVIAVLF